MPQGLLAKKLGMTQLNDEQGAVVPITLLQAGPCVVVDLRSTERDGYQAVQLGLVEARPRKRVSKPLLGHFKKAGVPPVRLVREFPLAAGESLKPGDQVLVGGLFKAGDVIDVVGVSKGKGFQGVVRRHHFRGGAATHGSMFHRAPGSVGASSFPSRTFPGTRMGGHMGARRVTTRNLTVVRVDEARNLIMVKGSVPGANGGYVRLQRTGG